LCSIHAKRIEAVARGRQRIIVIDRAFGPALLITYVGHLETRRHVLIAEELRVRLSQVLLAAGTIAEQGSRLAAPAARGGATADAGSVLVFGTEQHVALAAEQRHAARQ